MPEYYQNALRNKTTELCVKYELQKGILPYGLTKLELLKN